MEPNDATLNEAMEIPPSSEGDGNPDGEVVVAPEDATPRRVSLADVPPEYQKHLEFVRQQEKSKLYKDMKTLRESNTALTQEVARLKAVVDSSGEEGNAAPRRKSRAQEDEDTRLADVLNQLAEMRSEMAAGNQRRAEEDLADYRLRRIEALKSQGIGVVEKLVTGTNTEEIEISLSEAAEEYDRIRQSVSPEAPVEHLPTRSNSGVRVVRPTNSPVPAVIQPSSVAQNGTSLSKVKQVVNMEAMRDGTYAANRKQILRDLEQGKIK